MRALALVLAFSALAPGEPLTVPFVRQEKNGCGAASIAMVAQYWNRDGAPEPHAIYGRLIDPKHQGIELAAMKSYLEEIGFQAFTLRGKWSDLEQHLAKGRPIIVSLQEGTTKRLHFAVLAGVEEQSVWMNDPTRKAAHRADRAKFEKQWEGANRWMLLATPRPRP
jgi:ABC-type bacteriocin/lantibiotic exporter with double-glycine peptidase domain